MGKHLEFSAAHREVNLDVAGIGVTLFLWGSKASVDTLLCVSTLEQEKLWPAYQRRLHADKSAYSRYVVSMGDVFEPK